MRAIFGILALSTSLVACWSGNIFSPDGYSSDSYSDAQFAGTWTGEVSGVQVTFSMDNATCEFSCSASGNGTFVRSATGESGNFDVRAIFYSPGVPTNSLLDMDFTEAAPNDSGLRASFSFLMPDATHLVGQFVYDDLIQADTAATITFTRQ